MKSYGAATVYCAHPIMSKSERSPRRPPRARATSARRRALGQHFLASAAAARRIVELFQPTHGGHVIEIGPGRGALTGPLLDSGARVTAVEVDPDLATRLRERFAAHPCFALVEADILRCDVGELAGSEPARVLANLPYAITGQVLADLLAAGPPLTDMLLMLQREVVARLVAAPGGRTYGSLSVLAQYFTAPRAVMTLGPGAFTPPPAVSSAVVAMPFRSGRELARDAERRYPGFIRALFAHRRQTLLNNLKAARAWVSGGPGDGAPERAVHERLVGLLGRIGIDPSRRPETLAREECLSLFVALAG